MSKQVRQDISDLDNIPFAVKWLTPEDIIERYGDQHTVKEQKMYTCERCKNAPLRKGFPRPYQWKTERGFNNHKCYTEAQEKRDKTRAANKEKNELKKAERQAAYEAERQRMYDEAMTKRLEVAAHKPGDVVNAAFYRVTKGTHEQRYNRLVKVRYEEERSHQSGEMVVTEITLYGYRVVPKRMTYPSWEIGDKDIYPTLAEAEAAAKSRAQAYKEHCEFASMCR